MLSTTWTRIALSYALLALITGGVLALLLGGEFERREEEALRARLADEVRASAYSAAPLFAGDAPITATNSLAHQLSGVFGTRVTFIRPDGTVVGDSEQDPSLMENHKDRPEVREALARKDQPGSDIRLSATVHRRLLYVAMAVTDLQDDGQPTMDGSTPQPSSIVRRPSSVIGVARVAYPMTSVESARDALWGDLIIAVLLVSIPAVLLSTLLARSIVGPLSTLRHAAQSLGRGNLSMRSTLVTSGEIGELSREFNSMADQLSATILQLTTERNQMAAVLANMQDGVVLTDAQGRIQGINPAAALLLGSAPEQAAERSLIEVSHNHDLHRALSAALARREPQKLETEIAGHTIAAVVTLVPGADGGRPKGLVVLQDVTELRRLERVRRDFVTNIGHELRTPLASIKLLVETLETAVKDDPKVARGFLRTIDVELDGLTQLVRELLELSRIESGKVQLNKRPVQVVELLNSTVRRLKAQAERANLNLSARTTDPALYAYADAERVEQALVNLVHNAIKFTPPGGQITLQAASQKGGIVIAVEDTGIGIPPDDLPRIFERFYKVDKGRTGARGDVEGEASTLRASNRESGTGLGLAIAKHIVQAHGGHIWVESQLNRGTTFFFTLPSEGRGTANSG